MTTSWTKENVVIMHNDYDNTWTAKTIPVTYLQAIKFVRAKRWNNAMDKNVVRIVTLSQLKELPIR
jgi:hypothetical protein